MLPNSTHKLYLRLYAAIEPLLETWTAWSRDVLRSPPCWKNQWAKAIGDYEAALLATPWPGALPDVEAALIDLGQTLRSLLHDLEEGSSQFLNGAGEPKCPKGSEYRLWLDACAGKLVQVAQSANWVAETTWLRISKDFLDSKKLLIIVDGEKELYEYSGAEKTVRLRAHSARTVVPPSPAENGRPSAAASLPPSLLALPEAKGETHGPKQFLAPPLPAPAAIPAPAAAPLKPNTQPWVGWLIALLSIAVAAVIGCCARYEWVISNNYVKRDDTYKLWVPLEKDTHTIGWSELTNYYLPLASISNAWLPRSDHLACIQPAALRTDYIKRTSLPGAIPPQSLDLRSLLRHPAGLETPTTNEILIFIPSSPTQEEPPLTSLTESNSGTSGHLEFGRPYRVAAATPASIRVQGILGTGKESAGWLPWSAASPWTVLKVPTSGLPIPKELFDQAP